MLVFRSLLLISFAAGITVAAPQSTQSPRPAAKKSSAKKSSAPTSPWASPPYWERVKKTFDQHTQGFLAGTAATATVGGILTWAFRRIEDNKLGPEDTKALANIQLSQLSGEEFNMLAETQSFERDLARMEGDFKTEYLECLDREGLPLENKKHLKYQIPIRKRCIEEIKAEWEFLGTHPPKKRHRKEGKEGADGEKRPSGQVVRPSKGEHAKGESTKPVNDGNSKNNRPQSRKTEFSMEDPQRPRDFLSMSASSSSLSPFSSSNDGDSQRNTPKLHEAMLSNMKHYFIPGAKDDREGRRPFAGGVMPPRRFGVPI